MTEFTLQSGPNARVDAAVDWVEQRFGAETTKGRVPRPYTAHLYEVARIVEAHGGDEDQIVAALLHDAVEDAGGAKVLRDIERDFGLRVALIVDACTDSWVADPANKEAWWPRKVRYIEEIEDAAAGAHLVCAADKFANVRSCRRDYAEEGDAFFGHFNSSSGRDGQLWYYRRVTAELVAAGSDTGGLVEALDAEVSAWVGEVAAGTSGPPIEPEFAQWCAREERDAPTVGPAPERPTLRPRP